jgi:hypothetical protein
MSKNSQSEAVLHCQKLFTFFIGFFVLLATVCSFADEEIEDLIDIFESDGKVIAVLEGKKSVPFNLLPKEKVLWSDSKGYLGAFLTNKHFLVISTLSNSWRTLRLRTSVSDNRVAVLSPYIALLVTAGDRALGFDARSNRFIETRLPLNDELLFAKAEKYVAVVVTSSKAFGLAAGTSQFSEIPFGVRETVEAITTTSSKATIRTSHRLLSFEAKSSRWNEHRL